MRILKIRFKNLNSLAGEWSVDFTHPAYISDGIFAITGPTGAGKTTILDAICLALYGSTPRLERITKSGNEIMSRQTGECFAEVTFETQAGRFRSYWSQHRSRKKPDGELQAPKHEICEADSGRILESRLREVTERIESVTGMDFDRFTRSMLLAQGGFATFLQAPPDERAPILEQITGTEIYSRISMRVHEMRAEERQKLEALQTALVGLQLLDEQEEQRLHSDLQERLGREIELTTRREVLQKELTWLDGIAALEKELTVLDDRWQGFERRQLAFKADLDRLDRARSALALGGDYAKVTALRGQQEEELKELDEARGSLPAQEADLAKALQANQAAAEGLEAARAAQKREAGIIRKVRETDLVLTDKHKQIGISAEFTKQVERQQGDCLNRIAGSEKSLKKSHAMMGKTEAYLAEHAVDAGLVADLSAIGKLFDMLRAKEADRSKAFAGLAAALNDKEASIASCSKLEVDCVQSRARLTKAEQECRKITEKIEALLKGREPGEWRNELEILKDRRRFLDETGQILERVTSAQRTLEELETRRKQLAIEKVQVDEAIKSSIAKKSDCEREITHLEREVALLNRIRDLEGERARLEDGKPCPLCGATEHPYAEGNTPAMNDAESGLKQAKDELKRVSDLLTGLQIRYAETNKDIKRIQKDTQERQAALDADEERCAQAFADLKIDALPQERVSKVQDELTRVQMGVDESSKTIKGIEQAGKKEKAAQEALNKTRTACAEAEKALNEAVHKRDIAVREHGRLSTECAALEEQMAAASGEVLRDLAPYGIATLPMTGLDGILESFIRRKDGWQARQDEKNNLEKVIAGQKAELEKQNFLLSKLDEDLNAKRESHNKLTQEYEMLRGDRLRSYGEKNPDTEEKRFAGAVESAEKTLNQSREEHRRSDQNVEKLKARVNSLTDSTRKRTAELNHAEETLKTHLIRTGFEDEAEYLAACLPEEERKSLGEKAEALNREETALETLRKEKAGALQAERGKMITDSPHGTLDQELTACEKDLKEMQREIGAVRGLLNQNAILRAKQLEDVKKIEAQKKECTRWDDLHEIIGSADGKKYRNFAQELTFEMMIGHANRQLRKMSDRYLLVRDETQPLDLNVIDNYQAGEIRSTKNLSGGESFIVSLALALGLSHMASRNVRVDSLFLDEGFGTLDEDALETALEALAGLQQGGKLIGVISHVPALKERISTQIQVTPLTGGRSSISGPGCLQATAGIPQMLVA